MLCKTNLRDRRGSQDKIAARNGNPPYHVKGIPDKNSSQDTLKPLMRLLKMVTGLLQPRMGRPLIVMSTRRLSSILTVYLSQG